MLHLHSITARGDFDLGIGIGLHSYREMKRKGRERRKKKVCRLFSTFSRCSLLGRAVTLPRRLTKEQEKE